MVCIEIYAAIEIYDHLPNTPLLVRPSGGWWCSRDFVPLDDEAFDRIDNELCKDYLVPPPQAPGVGLAGALWVCCESDTKYTAPMATNMTTSYSSKPVSMTLSRLSAKMSQSWRRKSTSLSVIGAKNLVHQDVGRTLQWRDIHSLNLDPDQPTFERLEVLEKAGFARIAGVRFDECGQKGIVVYFAKGDVDMAKLTAPENEAYLHNAASMIGASSALSRSRKALLAKKGSNTIVKTSKKEVEDEEVVSDDNKFSRNVKLYARKLKGGNLQPPPPMPTKEALLTLFGAFVALMSVSGISEIIKMTTNDQYSIIMGPFGALITLQYALVMAPASQPRNILFGQVTAICISMSFSRIPIWIMPIWIRSSLATAVSIATISKMGIIHPPAGATALIISSNKFDWMVLPIMLLGNIVAIIVATLVNNVSDKRQYPTFLHLGENCVSLFVKKIREKKSRENKILEESEESAYVPRDLELGTKKSDTSSDTSCDP